MIAWSTMSKPPENNQKSLEMLAPYPNEHPKPRKLPTVDMITSASPHAVKRLIDALDYPKYEWDPDNRRWKVVIGADGQPVLDMRVVMDAAKTILERTFGKAVQPLLVQHNHVDNTHAPRFDLSKLTAKELEALDILREGARVRQVAQDMEQGIIEVPRASNAAVPTDGSKGEGE